MASGPIEELRRSIEGEVLRPGDEGYDAARRVWNGAIDRRPAAIARCVGPADVAASIRAAREAGLEIAVRGGGHGVGGHAVCEGGLVVDCGAMKRIRVNPGVLRAWAQAGVLWGELDAATQPFGLATAGGIVTHTGVAGLTLGGGIGWLMRRHGLTCDNLLSASLVTADGETVVAGEKEPELLWGLRGGGGNFGVVTEFEYRVHPVGPQVAAGVAVYAAEEAGAVLRAYRDVVAVLPDEVTTIVSLRHAPPAPYLPPDVHGLPVVLVAACSSGGVEEGLALLEPLRNLGRRLADTIGPTAYTAHQGIFDPAVPHGLKYYWKSEYLPPLTDAAIDTLVEHAWRMASAASYTIIFHMGGAVARRAEGDTAFGGRTAEHAVNINAVWEEPGGEADVEWTRAMHAAIGRHGTGGVYVNFLGEEGQERVRAAYGRQKYARLVALKDRYDPDNVYHLNQNIRPSG